MNQPSATSSSHGPGASSIDPKTNDASITCIRCGYSLYGLDSENGTCPECGLPVGRSTRGYFLRYADPDWLRTIWHGLNYLAAFLLVIVSFVIMLVAEVNDPPILLIALLIAAAPVMLFMGIFWSTRPDPMAIDEATLSSRRIARSCLLATPAIALVLAFAALHTREAGSALALLVLLPASLGLLALLTYTRTLARRIPRVKTFTIDHRPLGC